MEPALEHGKGLQKGLELGYELGFVSVDETECHLVVALVHKLDRELGHELDDVLDCGLVEELVNV